MMANYSRRSRLFDKKSNSCNNIVEPTTIDHTDDNPLAQLFKCFNNNVTLDDEVFCEMGKHFFTSMLKFNNILKGGVNTERSVVRNDVNLQATSDTMNDEILEASTEPTERFDTREEVGKVREEVRDDIATSRNEVKREIKTKSTRNTLDTLGGTRLSNRGNNKVYLNGTTTLDTKGYVQESNGGPADLKETRRSNGNRRLKSTTQHPHTATSTHFPSTTTSTQPPHTTTSTQLHLPLDSSSRTSVVSRTDANGAKKNREAKKNRDKSQVKNTSATTTHNQHFGIPDTIKTLHPLTTPLQSGGDDTKLHHSLHSVPSGPSITSHPLTTPLQSGGDDTKLHHSLHSVPTVPPVTSVPSDPPTPSFHLGSSYPIDIDDSRQRLNLNIYKFVDECLVRRDVSDVCKMDTVFVDDVLSDDKTLMLRAAFSGDIDLMRTLKIDVDYVDDVGRGAIHYASVSGSMECVQYLIELGANIDIVDKKDWSALHIAVSKNYTDVARVLIDAGCNIFKQLKHRCAPSRLVDVYSYPIHFAAIKGNIELTKLLLDNGANINELDSVNMTPLHYAAFRPNIKYLQFLLDLGADAYIKDCNGRTPFHTVALSGLVDNMKLLINKFSFNNDPDIWSLSPFTLAKIRNHTQLINYLLNNNNISTPINYYENCGGTGDINTIDVDLDNNSVSTYDDIDEMTMMLSSTIASALQEPNIDQIYRCVYRIGNDLCKIIFDLTLQIERSGGVLTADGKRRRTPGGIFFTLLKELYLNNIISKDDYNYIRAAENEKRCAKAIERRNKMKIKHSKKDVPSETRKDPTKEDRTNVVREDPNRVRKDEVPNEMKRDEDRNRVRKKDVNRHENANTKLHSDKINQTSRQSRLMKYKSNDDNHTQQNPSSVLQFKLNEVTGYKSKLDFSCNVENKSSRPKRKDTSRRK